MRNIVISIIVGIFAFVGLYETYAQNSPQINTQQMHQVVNKRVRQLNFVLGLTDVQKDSIGQILTRQYTNMQNAKSETGAAKSAAISKVENKTQNAMEKVLTPQQFKRYCVLKARYGNQQNK